MKNKDPQTDAQMAAFGHHREDLQPKLDWRERLRNEFPRLVNACPCCGGSRAGHWKGTEMLSFIAEVEKLAEERGIDKGHDMSAGFVEKEKLETRNSLKAELVEKIEANIKMYKGLIPNNYETGVKHGLELSQELIKSA